MSKKDKDLYENEEFVYYGKINILSIITKLFLLGFVVAALEIGLLFFNKFATSKGIFETMGWIKYVEIVVRVLLYLPFLIKFIKAIMIICNTKISLTNKRIIGVTGSSVRLSLDAPLSKIDNISVSQTTTGRIFGYATIKIMTNSAEFNFKSIRKANEFKKAAMETIEKYEDAARREQAQLTAQELVKALTAGKSAK